MTVSSFRDMYTAELQEARSLEAQLVEALPKLAQLATNAALGKALNDHLAQTRSQLGTVEEVLGRHGASVGEHRDQSMGTLLAEADKWVRLLQDPTLRDAAIIASARRIEHYEIAVYGTLSVWAMQLGFEEDHAVLEAILAQEKAADDTLSGLTGTDVNPQASALA